MEKRILLEAMAGVYQDLGVLSLESIESQWGGDRSVKWRTWVLVWAELACIEPRGQCRVVPCGMRSTSEGW